MPHIVGVRRAPSLIRLKHQPYPTNHANSGAEQEQEGLFSPFVQQQLEHARMARGRDVKGCQGQEDERTKGQGDARSSGYEQVVLPGRALTVERGGLATIMKLGSWHFA